MESFIVGDSGNRVIEYPVGVYRGDSRKTTPKKSPQIGGWNNLKSEVIRFCRLHNIEASLKKAWMGYLWVLYNHGLSQEVMIETAWDALCELRAVSCTQPKS